MKKWMGYDIPVNMDGGGCMTKVSYMLRIAQTRQKVKYKN